jgi:hypothetical protein
MFMCVVNLKSGNKLDLTWKQSFLISVVLLSVVLLSVVMLSVVAPFIAGAMCINKINSAKIYSLCLVS